MPWDPAQVYDLGAGAGNVTRLLKERWHDRLFPALFSALASGGVLVAGSCRGRPHL